MWLMQISSFICTEIGKKYSRQFTKGIEALHSRFRQAWPSCLQFTLVSEHKSKTEDMDMDFDVSCAEGLWMCTTEYDCVFTASVTWGRRSRLWITPSSQMWHTVGGSSEPTGLGSWLPVPSSARQLMPLHYHGWPPKWEQQEPWLPRVLLISLGSWF